MPRKIEFDGKVHEFPDQASDDQIREALLSTRGPQLPAVPPGSEKLGPLPGPAGSQGAPMREVMTPGTVADFGTGLARGGMSTVLSVPRLLTRVPGGLQDQLAARSQQTQRDIARSVLEAEQQSLPESSPSVAGQFGEMLGSTLPYLAAGPAAPILGVVGGTEEALTRADQNNAPLSPEGRLLAGLGGAVIGSTEALPIGRLFGHLKNAGVVGKAVDENKLAKELYPRLRDYAKSAGIQFVEEGGQEAAAGIAQDALEASYGGRSTDKIGEGFTTNLVGGGATGVVLDVLMKFAGSRAGRAHLRGQGVDPDALRDWYKKKPEQKSSEEMVDVEPEVPPAQLGPGQTPGKPQPPATKERGNRNKAGEQGPFAMPGAEEGAAAETDARSTQVDEPSTRVEKTEALVAPKEELSAKTWTKLHADYDPDTGMTNPSAGWNLKMGDDPYWDYATREYLKETYGLSDAQVVSVLLGSKSWSTPYHGSKSPVEIRNEWRVVEKQYLASLGGPTPTPIKPPSFAMPGAEPTAGAREEVPGPETRGGQPEASEVTSPGSDIADTEGAAGIGTKVPPSNSTRTDDTRTARDTPQPQATATESEEDAWEAFADDLSQAGVSIPHMVNSFKKNFNLDLEKDVREGRFGTDKISVDQLKDLAKRYPQKGPKPAPRKRTKAKEPEVSLEDQLAASLRARGIEVPAEPTAGAQEAVLGQESAKPEESGHGTVGTNANPAIQPDTKAGSTGSTDSKSPTTEQPQPQATADISDAVKMTEEDGAKLNPTELDIWRERAKPLNDLSGKPTGWRELRQSDGVMLIHEKDHRVVTFKATDGRSGTGLRRAVAEAHGWAIDNATAATPAPKPNPFPKKAKEAPPEHPLPKRPRAEPELVVEGGEPIIFPDKQKAPSAETGQAVTPQRKIIDSVQTALDEDGSVIELEKIAEGVYGAKRTSGAFTKRQAYEAQEAGMNSWMRNRSKEIMSMEPKKAIGYLRDKVKRLATQSVRDDEQVRRQQFSTPPHLAYLAQKVAAVTPDDSVLEPSGGTGGLVSLVLPVAKSVHLNEIDPERAALAREVGFTSQTNHNAEVINALLPADVKPTVVIMNPPFSMGGFNEQGEGANRTLFGYQHVESALQRLQPGGRLVAILSGGMQGRGQGARLTAPQAAKFWQRMAQQYNIRANVGIPGKEYSKYGTSFPTQLVIIDKTGPTPGSNYAAQVKQAIAGDFDSIEAAWDALSGIAQDRGTVAGDKIPARDSERGTGVGTDSGSVQQSGDTRSGTAASDVQGKGTRPGRASTRPDAEVRSGDASQPDRAGESEVRSPQDGKDASGGDRESAVQQSDDLTAAAGLTPDQLIAQVTANIEAKRNPKPTPKTPQKPKKSLQQQFTEQKEKKQQTPKAAASVNPLKQQADAARERLRAKMRGSQLNSGIDPQDLIDIATIGAEKMIDGATKFEAWAKSMREDVGDLIDWMAKTTKQTADKVLRTIHDYARRVAKNFNVEAEEAPAEQEPESDVAVKRRQKQTAKEDSGAFVIYEPTLEGTPHPGAIVESKSMATVSLPPLTYEPSLPASTKISAVQLESVVIAGQQNERRNGDGSRGAALIGDGTGVGKGRTVAAILWDNWNQGRKRLVWVSEKWDLIEDSMEYLEAVGAKHLAEFLVPLNKLDNKGTIVHEGVVFTTYDLIRSKDKKGNTTVSALEVWLKGQDEAEGAFVAFDEAHEMKNTVPAGRALASQMGVAAKKLRDALPNLRTVYMSATSATEVENMGYLERLGLWGPRTPFPNGFAQFVNEVGSGGIATMELIARELKATGKYIARTLSYKGVKYDEVTAELNPDQREIYRKAASAWRMVTAEVEKAIVNVNGGREARSQFMSQYWSANQRFFNLLLTALKVPAAIELAERGLNDKDNPKSIVITLQNTNEAAQNRQEAKLKGEEDGEPDDLDFGPKDILTNLVMEHYPVQQWVDVVVTGVDGKQKIEKKPLTRKDPETGKDVPVLNPQAIAERDALVKQLERDLHMPANPLDILIEHFGRDNVAELTGRSKYYDAATGRFEKRGGDLPRKKVNIAAAQDFQDGRKRVAILSQAAGTGISLHASNDAKNQQQRWHITLQAGWSADKAMQMLGRTHRTNQKHTPYYLTLVSDMSGEKRFLATIAKRMGSLGALTRGDSEATGGADMSNVNYESAQGQQAAVTFVQRLENGQQVPGVNMDGFSVLREMGLTKKIEVNGQEREVVSDNAGDVRRILNRLLALDPDIQQKVFEYYHQIFEAAVQQAIEQGTLDTGVKELQGDSISIDEQRVLSADRDTGAETHYYRVTVHEKAPVADVEDLDKAMKRHPDGTFYVNSRTMHVVFAREADPIVSANGQVREAVYSIRPSNKNWAKNDKPVITDRSVVVDLDTLIERELKDAEQAEKTYERDRDWAVRSFGADSSYAKQYTAKAEEAKAKLAEWKAREADRIAWAKELWEKQYDDTPKTTETEHHLIGGAVLRWWNTVKQNQGIRLARDSKTGERVVGAVISPAQIQNVLAQIAGGRVQVSPSQIITDVLRNGTEYQLEHGVRLRRGRVSRDQVIQVAVPDQQTGRRLTDLGVIYEKGVTPVYYIPNGTGQGAIIERILAQYPVDSGARSSEAGFASPELFGAHLIARGITKIEEWIKRMVERYGPEIRKRALAIWREAKRLAADEVGSLGLRENSGMDREQAARVRFDDIVKKGEYDYYGLRVVSSLSDHYTEEYLERNGLPKDPVRLKVGDTAPQSFQWKDNDTTGELQDGTSAIDYEARNAWEALRSYSGSQVALLGSNSAATGEDKSEIVMRGAKVLAVWDRTDDGLLKRLWSDETGTLDLAALRESGEKAARMVKDAYDVALKSMGARIKDESPRLASMLQHARDVGDVMAGGFLNRLIDAKLNKLTKVEQEMLAAVLEGKMKGAPRKVVDAYRVVRNLENDVATIADSLGVDLEKVLPKKYDKDTARSIPHQFAAAGEKLAQFAEFGKDNAELKRILKALGDVGGNPKQVQEWVERVFKGVDEGKTQEEKITRFIRGLQTAKLGLAFIPNASQAILNVTPAADFRALYAGYKALLSAEGRRFAVESGAAIDPVLPDAPQEVGLGWLTQKFMAPFKAVEQHNRIVAASAGADFAARLWKMAQADTKKGKWAARKLADLGIDASTPLTRADILMAAKKFTDQTQFRSRPENLPAWSTTPWGRVFFQFKQFSYQQARFTLDQTFGELRRGDPLRAGRNLAMFALLGGGMGELIRLLRNLLTGREDDPEGTERVAKAMASAGALGVMLDATQAMERGKELEWLAGPGADMGINAARLGWTWVNPDEGMEDKAEATKKFIYRHAPLGSIAKGIEERLR